MLYRLSALALLAATFTAHAADSHWGYEGEHGPAHWGNLSPANVACERGTEQSPIDIRTSQIKHDGKASDLDFAYHSVPLKVVNNGHTVQVDEAGAGTLTVGGHAYTLAQFHFHTPSEETIDGQHYDMVAHYVHKDAEGHLAVVAVLFKEGQENAGLSSVFANMPVAAGPMHDIEGVSFNPNDLLPANHGYFHFMGSLTTPPCSEGVSWYVLETPVEASHAQIELLHKLYNHNNRPVQPVNAREIVEHS